MKKKGSIGTTLAMSIVMKKGKEKGGSGDEKMGGGGKKKRSLTKDLNLVLWTKSQGLVFKGEKTTKKNTHTTNRKYR